LDKLFFEINGNSFHGVRWKFNELLTKLNLSILYALAVIIKWNNVFYYLKYLSLIFNTFNATVHIINIFLEAGRWLLPNDKYSIHFDSTYNFDWKNNDEMKSWKLMWDIILLCTISRILEYNSFLFCLFLVLMFI